MSSNCSSVMLVVFQSDEASFDAFGLDLAFQGCVLGSLNIKLIKVFSIVGIENVGTRCNLVVDLIDGVVQCPQHEYQVLTIDLHGLYLCDVTVAFGFEDHVVFAEFAFAVHVNAEAVKTRACN